MPEFLFKQSVKQELLIKNDYSEFGRVAIKTKRNESEEKAIRQKNRQGCLMALRL